MSSGFDARPAMPTLLWLGAIGTALLASLAVADASVPVAAGAAVIALSLLKGPIAGRLLTVAAIVPIAFVDSSPPWAWIAAGAALGLATSFFQGGQAQAEPNGDLQRHLAWCRRREEPANLLVAPLEGIDELAVRSLLESFRITDSVTLGRSTGGTELYALLDAHGFMREGLERRLAETFAGRNFGWATFPEDGVTLQTLIEHARGSMREAREHAGKLAVVPEPLIQPERGAPTPALEHVAGGS
jgi:hypothetical protein